jgi:rhodanese-related sulfurtransferase
VRLPGTARVRKTVEQITPQELKAWLDDSSRARPVLVDVREPWEVAVCALPGAVALPMNAVPERAGELDPAADTVVICHHGARSFQVGMFLERRGFGRVYNLHGGVDAWARQIDPLMAVY